MSEQNITIIINSMDGHVDDETINEICEALKRSIKKKPYRMTWPIPSETSCRGCKSLCSSFKFKNLLPHPVYWCASLGYKIPGNFLVGPIRPIECLERFRNEGFFEIPFKEKGEIIEIPFKEKG